jgi:FtsP/CotA-like multicopper oxidase with cupredoxin domain
MPSRPDRTLSRRTLLHRGAALGSVALGGAMLLGGAARPALALAQAAPELVIGTRILEVKGKAAKVFRLGLRGDAASAGISLNAGEHLRLRLVNECGEPALIHWHGLTPPNAQDGVPGLTQPLLQPGLSYEYDFPVALPGTNWMHSHHVLQEQHLMAAPLIVRDPADAARDEQEVVIMLHDFTFRVPDEILAGLTKGMSHDHAAMSGGMMDSNEMQQGQMDHAQMGHDMSNMAAAPQGTMPGMGGMDLNDVAHDAFLANDRTLDDPQVVRVERGQRLRLRIINGAAATNFMIDLGALEGTLSDVDGRPIRGVAGNRFPLAVAQRADIRLALPAGEGAWPILFQREGDVVRTGLVLATKDGSVAKIGDRAAAPIGAIDREAPMLYAAAEPLPPRLADRQLQIALTGSMMDYRWGVSDLTGISGPIGVKQGERVELELLNRTEMSHPMHLHGHHFQVVAVNGKRVEGALRDTELVPIGGSVTIAFDADNPGRWMFHCHNLYHMLSGMMTEVGYL